MMAGIVFSFTFFWMGDQKVEEIFTSVTEGGVNAMVVVYQITQMNSNVLSIFPS